MMSSKKRFILKERLKRVNRTNGQTLTEQDGIPLAQASTRNKNMNIMTAGTVGDEKN
jgi:hypothetical protein